MDKEYARSYRDLYTRHWWFRAREKFVLDQIEPLLPTGGFSNILDVGCGDGLLFPALKTFGTPQGVEPNRDIVTKEGRRNGTIHQCEFGDDFQPKQKFGLILILDVIEHLDNDFAALRRARELLDDDGCLLVTVPAFQSLWTQHDEINLHRRRYRRRELVEIAERAGLSVQFAGYFFHWILPLKLMTRLREKILKSDPYMKVPNTTVNRLLYGVSRLEQATWGQWRIPFGTSIVLLARSDNRLQ